MKRAWLALLPLPILAAVLLYLMARKKITVIGADGRTYQQLSPANLRTDGEPGAPSIWCPVPPDGEQYFPDLGFDAGTSTQPPIMRRFGA